MQIVLTNELLLEAYKQGLFPMAYNADSPYVHWICPEERGQLSIQNIHIPRSLKKTIKSGLHTQAYEIRINTDFSGVIRACAEPQPDRPESWINEEIIKAFIDLHTHGHAHSVEYWEDGALKGGLYGLAIGGAFFGESMFSRVSNASKIALIHLIARLWAGGFSLLDTQFTNPHLKQFGVYEIPHGKYMTLLKPALSKVADFELAGRREQDLVLSYFEYRAGL